MPFHRISRYKSIADIEIGNRVKFVDEYGDTRYGEVCGRSFSGGYVEIEADSGGKYGGQVCDMDIEIL